jgi:hypothetical protein
VLYGGTSRKIRVVLDAAVSSDGRRPVYWRNASHLRLAKVAGDRGQKLRQVDVLVSQGQVMADAIRQIGVSEVTYYRWRQEFGGLKIALWNWIESRLGRSERQIPMQMGGFKNRFATISSGLYASLALLSSLMSETYLKSDHFSGGGSLREIASGNAGRPLSGLEAKK